MAEAVKARNRLLLDRDAGRTPGPRITPQFCDYYKGYVNWLESTKAKSPLTIEKENCALKGWAKFLGTLRLNQITRKTINDYVVQRTTGDSGVCNRTANLDMVALGNILKFAKNEGLLKDELPTDSWKPLKYVTPRRSLLSLDQIEAICNEARAIIDGKPKYENGQFLADYIKLLAFSGARRLAGLSLSWDQIDFANRQITFHTKFDKSVTVEFNDKLEAHLKDLRARRQDETNPWVFPSPRPPEEGQGYFGNPYKLLNEVKAGVNMPRFTFHCLRHFFISRCVVEGIDIATIASWVGHVNGQLIFSTYTHLDPKHKRDVAAKLQFTPRDTTKSNPNLVTLDLSKMSALGLLAFLQQEIKNV